MNRERCAFCGARASERDHLTGRPTGTEAYFDPEVWVPCCRTCNLVNEHAWGACGLLVATEPFPVVRRQRLAFGLGRLCDAGWAGPVHPALWGGLRRFVLDVASTTEHAR